MKTETYRWLTLFVLFGGAEWLGPQGTAFTYQGSLIDNGNRANGTYDIRFTVCDAATDGNDVAGPLTNSATAVSNGFFSATLDFGAGVFTGPARRLQLDVCTNGAGVFTRCSLGNLSCRRRMPSWPTARAICWAACRRRN